MLKGVGTLLMAGVWMIWKKGRRKKIKAKRQWALDSLKTCFQDGANTVLTETAMRELKADTA